jgi:hypothetical protein
MNDSSTRVVPRPRRATHDINRVTRRTWLAWHTARAGAAIAAATAIAACGSNSPRSLSSSDSNAAQAQIAEVHNESLRFARCIRANGVPNFPDSPGNGSYGLKSFAQQSNGETLSINGVPVSAPAFRSAMVTCHQYLPQPPPPTATDLARARAQAVKYGQCMRGRGINIPDPQIGPGPGGHGIGRQIDIPPGMTQSSPAFEAANQTCRRRVGWR